MLKSSYLIALSLWGCGGWGLQPKSVKPSTPQPISFQIRNDANEPVEIFKIMPKGELIYRGNTITSNDEIIAAFYDMVVTKDKTLSTCLNKLELYRSEHLLDLKRRLVKSESQLLKKSKEKAEEKVEEKVKEKVKNNTAKDDVKADPLLP